MAISGIQSEALAQVQPPAPSPLFTPFSGPKPPAPEPLSGAARFFLGMGGMDVGAIEQRRFQEPYRLALLENQINRERLGLVADEDILRRQQAREAALNMIAAKRRMPRAQLDAALLEQGLIGEVAGIQSQVQGVRRNAISLAELERTSKMTPLEREQEQWEALFGALPRAVQNVFGGADEAKSFMQTQELISTASQAEQFQKGQALESLFEQIELSSGQEFRALTTSDRKDARALLDQFLAMGMEPSQALAMTGEGIVSSIGPRQADLGPGGFAGLSPPVAQRFDPFSQPTGGPGFAESMGEIGEAITSLPRALNQAGLSINALIRERARRPTATADEVARVKARVQGAGSAAEAKRTKQILRDAGVLSLDDLDKLDRNQLALILQRIEGSL